MGVSTRVESRVTEVSESNFRLPGHDYDHITLSPNFGSLKQPLDGVLKLGVIDVEKRKPPSSG